MLERQKVAEEVKGLDQPSRANLRKYGVRFGAYHLYMPALLKPAPRSLAAQLWMLKHEGPEAKGLDDLQRLAGSGRTSIPVDKDTPKPLYRTIGYRVCGERAIRVDILERLADLIRPALAWREGAIGTTPAGRVQRLRLHGHRRDDFAHRRLWRGLRLDPALARLSHGEAAEAGRSRKQPPTTPELTPAATTVEASAARRGRHQATATEEVAEHAPTLAPDSEPVTDVVIEAEQPAAPPEPAVTIEPVADRACRGGRDRADCAGNASCYAALRRSARANRK